jgi:hypothetical protein
MIEIIGYVLSGFILGIFFCSWLIELLVKSMNDEQFNLWSEEKRIIKK